MIVAVASSVLDTILQHSAISSGNSIGRWPSSKTIAGRSNTAASINVEELPAHRIANTFLRQLWNGPVSISNSDPDILLTSSSVTG